MASRKFTLTKKVEDERYPFKTMVASIEKNQDKLQEFINEIKIEELELLDMARKQKAIPYSQVQQPTIKPMFELEEDDGNLQQIDESISHNLVDLDLAVNNNIKLNTEEEEEDIEN